MAIVVILFTGPNLFAKPTLFKNDGLKNETLVTLEVAGKTAGGTYVSHDNMEDTGPATPFTGKVIPTPKGKRGVYLEIHFAGRPPYNVPPNTSRLIWYLKIVNGRAHLFIPMQERSYEARTPRWVVDDVELEPQDDVAPSR